MFESLGHDLPSALKPADVANAFGTNDPKQIVEVPTVTLDMRHAELALSEHPPLLHVLPNGHVRNVTAMWQPHSRTCDNGPGGIAAASSAVLVTQKERAGIVNQILQFSGNLFGSHMC